MSDTSWRARWAEWYRNRQKIYQHRKNSPYPLPRSERPQPRKYENTRYKGSNPTKLERRYLAGEFGRDDARGKESYSIGFTKDHVRHDLRCRTCNVLLPPPEDLDWLCEFGGPARMDCRCNWCQGYQAWRPANRPPEYCDGCQSRRGRDRQATSAERKREAERLRALDVVRENPDLTDKEAAKLADTIPKRVKEARKLL